MSLADLYNEYEALLHRFAQSLTHDSFRADDLVQETFMRAMGHMALLEMLNPHQQRAWLTQTLKNLFFDEQKIWKRRDEILAEVNQETAQFTPSPETQIGNNPFELIPEEYQELFTMRYTLGMNSQEIADELGIPAATVRSRLHLATRKIRRRNTEI